MNTNLLKDVITRTEGELFIGVVGAVRTGKSTFIRKFMEKKVLPYITDSEVLEKTKDELPQSADGRRVMTMEPKFIPSEHMEVNFGDNLKMSVRLVDCVGYIIPSAVGYLNEDGTSRLVKTPWFSDEIPFDEAAKIGTKKVIDVHSHIGIIITSDGSFGDFSREEYEKIEADLISELKKASKPFIVILNTTHPNSTDTQELAKELETRYQVSIIPLNVQEVEETDIDELLKKALSEYEIEEMNIDVPEFISVLKENNSYKEKYRIALDEVTKDCHKMKDVYQIVDNLQETGLFDEVNIVNLDAGHSKVDIQLQVNNEKYKKIVEEILGTELDNQKNFIQTIQELTELKNNQNLINKPSETGFIIPPIDEMILQEPTLIKQGNRYGIKLSAIANVTHACNVEVTSSFEPIIGGEMQTKMLLEHMVDEYKKDPNLIWNTEFFGQKLSNLISDGVKVKIKEVGTDIEKKYQESLTKIVNKGKGVLVAIVY